MPPRGNGSRKPADTDPADRAAVEVYFETVSDSLAELPPEDRAAALRDYVLKLGVMPDALVREFRGGLWHIVSWYKEGADT